MKEKHAVPGCCDPVATPRGIHRTLWSMDGERTGANVAAGTTLRQGMATEYEKQGSERCFEEDGMPVRGVTIRG